MLFSITDGSFEVIPNAVQSMIVVVRIEPTVWIFKFDNSIPLNVISFWGFPSLSQAFPFTIVTSQYIFPSLGFLSVIFTLRSPTSKFPHGFLINYCSL